MIKIVLVSVIATVLIMSFLLTFFLNSILGVFGLVSTTVSSLASLKQSSHLVQNMKKRHKIKRSRASKRFIKRSGRKVASLAVSAATIGTAGVVLTVISLEVADYCEERRDLHEDEQVLFNTQNSFDYQECLVDAKEDSVRIVNSVKEVVPGLVGEAWKSTAEESQKLWRSLVDLL